MLRGLRLNDYVWFALGFTGCVINAWTILQISGTQNKMVVMEKVLINREKIAIDFIEQEIVFREEIRKYMLADKTNRATEEENK